MSWLAIVGIGEDGIYGLSLLERQRISEAEIVFGGARHLELAGALIRGEARAWESPFSRSIEAVLAQRGRPVCVLASGDPMLFGVGATLARQVEAGEMDVLPAPSAFSLAAARLGWALQDVVTLSLHGGSMDLIRPHLHKGTRIIALTSDQDGPEGLAKLLTDSGFGASEMTVLEALGGARERVRRTTANGFDLGDIHPLNVCAITVSATRAARVLPLAAGLDDALFEHDGQITKREIRALTLSALAPRRGELLWDIGAGSGSVGIEWMLADPSLRTIAIEADDERAARIGRNAAMCGVPELRVITGAAPGALAELAAPDAIFVGGGGSEAGVMEAAMGALSAGGRIVVNAVTMEMESLLLLLHAELGGNLSRIDIARAAPLGGMTGWQPARPITQWSWTKP